MSTVKDIENAVRQLTDDDRAAFRACFAEFDADEWDRQLGLTLRLAGSTG